MRSSHRHAERHRTDRVGRLRAAMLRANDGIVSAASLLVGVAAASATHASMLDIGVAGRVAGARSTATAAGVGALVGNAEKEMRRSSAVHAALLRRSF